MARKVEVFLDTSALFAGIWSKEGGGREILRLGEAGVLQVRVSPHILNELEDVLRRKAPEMLGSLALLLDRVGVDVVPDPPAAAVARCARLTGYLADARVLAAAWEAGPDYFTTLDREHFLENTVLRDRLPFPLGTPGDLLSWFRSELGTVRVQT